MSNSEGNYLKTAGTVCIQHDFKTTEWSINFFWHVKLGTLKLKGLFPQIPWLQE